MSKQVKTFLGKEFAEAYYRWVEASIEKAHKNNDPIGLEALQKAKGIYFLDYMADWFDECATIATNMVTEEQHD